jgi:hypothetical protein
MPGPLGDQDGGRASLRAADVVLSPPPRAAAPPGVNVQSVLGLAGTTLVSPPQPTPSFPTLQSALPNGYTPSSRLAGVRGEPLMGRIRDTVIFAGRLPGSLVMPFGTNGGAGSAGVWFDFGPSPYHTPHDIPVPQPGVNPTDDAPLGKGLEQLPGGHPWQDPPFPHDPDASAPYYRLLYAQFKWTARFTNDGYVMTDLVDISDCLEVKVEEKPVHHVAARFSHAKLQKALNAAQPKHADQMPIVKDQNGDVFFNDLDDIGFELKPPPPGGVPPVHGPGKPASPRDGAEKGWNKLKKGIPKKETRVLLNVRYIWPNKKNPVPEKDRPKGPPKKPK